MATPATDNTPFIPVTQPRNAKKAKTTAQAGNHAKPEIESELRLVFQLPQKSTTAFNPASSTKHLLTEMIKHDPTIMFKALEDEDMYYPAHDPFPIKEKDFQQYFHVHNQPKRSVRPNLITIGCHVFSSKTINEIKKSTLETHTMMEWLTANHIFIEADTLGRRAIRTIGYFFNVHPNITHRTSFKTNISDALDRVRMKKSEAIELAPEAAESYELDIDDEDDTFPFVPPFEIFVTYVGYGTGTTRVRTRALAIKTNVVYGQLLHELLLRMATNKTDKTDNPLLKYVPVGTAHTLGPEPYKQLIRTNNAYLNSVATIPVIGIPDEALELRIETRNSDHNPCYKTLKEIFLDNEWCCNIEPTETAGKILFITTKGDLDVGRQWLDENLAALFTVHLPKNQHFRPDPENPIAKRKENDQVTPTLQAYMDSLKQTIQPTALSSKSNQSKFAKPPTTRASQLIPISYKQTLEKNLPKTLATQKQPPKTDNNKKRRTNDNSSTKSTDNDTEVTMLSNQTTAITDLKQEIIATL